MPKVDGATKLVVAGACIACCLPLIVAAGPVVAVAGAVAAGAGAAGHVVRRSRRKRVAAVDSP
jgi:hypothetical protein